VGVADDDESVLLDIDRQSVAISFAVHGRDGGLGGGGPALGVGEIVLARQARAARRLVGCSDHPGLRLVVL